MDNAYVMTESWPAPDFKTQLRAWEKMAEIMGVAGKTAKSQWGINLAILLQK